MHVTYVYYLYVQYIVHFISEKDVVCICICVCVNFYVCMELKEAIFFNISPLVLF